MTTDFLRTVTAFEAAVDRARRAHLVLERALSDAEVAAHLTKMRGSG